MTNSIFCCMKLKKISVLVSALFVSQTLIANEVAEKGNIYTGFQANKENPYVYTGQHFENGLEFSKEEVATDQIVFNDCTYEKNLLKFNSANINIGAIDISDIRDRYEDTDYNNSRGVVKIVGNKDHKVAINQINIKNSNLISHVQSQSNAFFLVEGYGYTNLEINGVNLTNLTFSSSSGSSPHFYGISFQSVNFDSIINSLSVKGLHSSGNNTNHGIHFATGNVNVNLASIENVTAENLAIGLDVENGKNVNFNKVIVKEVKGAGAFGVRVSGRQSDVHIGSLVIDNVVASKDSRYDDRAYGIWASNLIIDNGLIIKNIIGPKSYAIFAGEVSGEKEGKGLIIRSELNTINQISGDIGFNRWGEFGKVEASFRNSQSYFEGKVDQTNQTGAQCNLTFDNGAHWAVTGDSWTTNLNVSNGAYVDLMADKNPTRLTASKFTGNGGSLNLHFDPTQPHDLVEINEGSGTFDIVLDVSNGDQIKNADWNNFIITQKKGNLHLGQLKYKDGAVKAFKVAFWGSNDTTVPGTINSNGEDGRWIVYLPEIIDGLPLEPPSKIPALPLEPPSKVPALPLEPPSKVPALPLEPPSKVPATPLEPVEPIEPPVDQNPGFDKPPTTPEVDQILALGTSAAQGLGMLQETEDLRTRMGDIRSGESDGVWARTFARQDRAYGSYGHSFKQESYGIYFGADRAWRHNSGSSLVGLAMHLGKSDQKEIGGGEAGSGKMDQYSLKAYGTWMSDRGSFIDIVGLLGYYDTELNGVSNTGKRQLKADYNTWGYGLSAEIGHRFAWEQPTSTWFVEPTAQLSWYRVLGKDFSTNTGIKVEQSDTDFLVGRAGLAVGKTIPLGQNDGQSLTFTLKGGMLYQFDGDQTIKVSGTDDSSLNLQALSMNGARAYYGSTVDWRIDDAWRLYGQISREEGSGYTKDYDFSVGVQYRW